MTKIAVLNDQQDDLKSKQLAERLGVSLLKSASATDADYLLLYVDGALTICTAEEGFKSGLTIDFCSKKSKHLKLNQGKGKLPISKACGIKQNQRPSIIDGTAGFGQDSFLLASFGCEVNAVEQQPIIAELLSDALNRASEFQNLGSESIPEIANRIHLHCETAEAYLCRHRAEVVYLDPMYPIHEHQKQAKVKKQMQLLRAFDGTSSDEQTLFTAGFESSTQRLVVKRPNWASHLAGEKPSHNIPGKTHRYDVYLH